MKFTSTLFSLAVVATTTTDHYGVHGMSDDMDNTTDFKDAVDTEVAEVADTVGIGAAEAAAGSSDGEGGGGFWSGVKDKWGDMKTVTGCDKDIDNMYKGNDELGAAWDAWHNALKVDESLSTEGGNSTYSYTSAYSADTTAAYKEECEKVDGNTWTAVPDRSFQCRKEGEDKGWITVNVAVSNNGVCLPDDSEDCNTIMTDANITAADFADNSLYTHLSNDHEIYCNEMEIGEDGEDDDDSGGVVTSTNFIGSLVAATAVLAFTVLN
eukprot:CAMPEP_0170784034 /NCGR_PEP_ID=MMETSP0733-20121128/15921_1 /TAXON_ID=186038 /ORGANISM="Fragilariopsis kerguelensis, Strain L26-C5" /LENGTH=266 /DNA_ID=CAMNT_0011128921 /DNA_START=69 /DNA_END=869 /DNA_ORIENTATION=+